MKPLLKLRTVLEMIKFEHTIFALPFALVGMLLAAEGWPSGRIIFWIIVAMVGARSAAMSFNRLADRHIDAANPRTADRALPAGKIGSGFVGGFVLATAALMVLAAWQLNALALRLSPVALLIILGYSYTKRWTAWSHIFLGLALSGAPLGAWLAVRGEVAPTPLVLAVAVLCWVAGFDVLYALQDQQFDRSQGLHSIPARFGEKPALWISAGLHLVMLLLLGSISQIYPPGLGLWYWIGLAGCATLLIYQHSIVRPGDLSRLDAAFFQANGLLAVWFLCAVAADIWL